MELATHITNDLLPPPRTYVRTCMLTSYLAKAQLSPRQLNRAGRQQAAGSWLLACSC